MTPYIAVLGTWGRKDDPTQCWWHYASGFSAFMRSQGFDHAKPREPFRWSGDLQGIPLLASGKDWEAGADALAYYVDCIPESDRRVVAHSHGGQVVLLAAAAGVRFRSVVLVGTPVRKSIERTVAPAAVKHIGRCVHVCDARWDKMGLLGAIADGRLSLRRTFEVEGIDSRKVKGIGHSGLLYDPRKFPLWLEHGWLRVLRGEAAAAV